MAAAAPSAPSRLAAARWPACSRVPSDPGFGLRTQGRRGGWSPGRGAHLRDERRRWRRAPSAPGSGPALRSARPEGRDRRGGRVPAPFNFGGGAGWRPASGTVGIPLSARGVAESALLATVSQRASSLVPTDAAATPGWKHPRGIQGPVSPRMVRLGKLMGTPLASRVLG